MTIGTCSWFRGSGDFINFSEITWGMGGSFRWSFHQTSGTGMYWVLVDSNQTIMVKVSLLKDIDGTLQEAQQTIMDDSSHGRLMFRYRGTHSLSLHSLSSTDHGRLFQVVYETDSRHKTEIEPHMWTYRPRINLKHLMLSVQREKDLDKDISVLKEFLQKVTQGR